MLFDCGSSSLTVSGACLPVGVICVLFDGAALKASRVPLSEKRHSRWLLYRAGFFSVDDASVL